MFCTYLWALTVKAFLKNLKNEDVALKPSRSSSAWGEVGFRGSRSAPGLGGQSSQGGVNGLLTSFTSFQRVLDYSESGLNLSHLISEEKASTKTAKWMPRGSGERKALLSQRWRYPLSHVLINMQGKGSTTVVKRGCYKQASRCTEWFTVDRNAWCMVYD